MIEHRVVAALALVTVATGCHPTATYTSAPIFNAICPASAPEPGQDATSLVQAAISARCRLPAGVYEIATPAPNEARRRYDMLTVAAGQSLCGSGPATVLRFAGDAAGQDWRGVGLASELCDLTLDTSALTGTSEQTHAARVPPGSKGVRIHGVTFVHPIRGTQKGGDCVDIVGYTDALVRDTIISDNVFAHCDRASIQVHSGAVGLTIERNLFLDTGDFDINSEPGGASSDWLVTTNEFHASASNQGAFAVAFDLVQSARLVANSLERGVYLYGCKGCEVSGNTITAKSGHSANQGTIDAIKGTSDLTIADNAITRTSTQDTGPVIHVGPHGTEQSRTIRIVANRLEQNTPSDVISIEGAQDVTIAGNEASYTLAGGNVNGVRLQGSGGDNATPISGVTITDNTFSGMLRSAVFMAGAANRAGVGSVTMNGNRSERPGLLCENLSGIKGPVTLVYNTWMPGSCGVPSLAVSVP